MGERVTVVVRRLLGLTVVLGFSALSVATSAPLNYVRGEVAVTEATASGAPGARAKVFVLLPVEDDAGQPMVHTVTLDEDGEGEWPTLWHDQMSARAVSDFQQPLLVAWAPGRGDVQRLYLDAELEQEGRYRALLLDHNYFVARSFFRLAALGHAPALEVHEGGQVHLPAAAYPRWIVFASEGQPLKAHPMVATRVDLELSCPPGFAGEVFAVWGSDRQAPRMTTPAPITDCRTSAAWP
jgi:hypothetical protein